MKIVTPEARKLFHDGAQELAYIEASGMRIDVGYLDDQIKTIGQRISKLASRLRECEEFKTQRKRFGTRCKLTSRDQLAFVLYGDGKTKGDYEPLARTPTGKPQLDEAALEAVGTKYCRGFLRMEKLRKLQSTYLTGIRSKVVDGFLHPSFPLHMVLTYRGSSSDPNFQNIPIRDPDIAKIIRRAFIPRDGHVILEIDLKANEVRVACCYTGDERLIKDTTTGDMHGDMAAEIFCLPRDEVPKAVRQEAKGKFVFAEFYGDYWAKVAANLWDGVGSLITNNGMAMEDHLANKGIYGLGRNDGILDQGTFVWHIKQIEHSFWHERYSVYNQWKKDWFDLYCERGWYDMKTGFVCQGIYTRNQVNNGPIQGSAFHCLLWVLIRLNRWLRKNRMRSVIIGQIHDSIELDVHPDELDDVKAKAKSLLEDEIREAWPWLIIPLAGEAEISESNWYEKRAIAL